MTDTKLDLDRPVQSRMNITPREREIVEHALGLNYKKKPYRNHYCVAHDDPELLSMVDRGYMRLGLLLNEGRDRYFHVTESGADAVGHSLPKDD